MKITKSKLRALILKEIDDLSKELVQDREIGGEPTEAANQIETIMQK